MELSGSTVLLTGATGGIGQATARALHARGARVLLSGRRVELLEALRDELGGTPVVIPADLSSTAAAAELAAAAGEVDALVANAALPASGQLDDFSPNEIDRALDVNLRAPIQLARLLLPGMLERRRGQLVFVSSLSGKVATTGSSLYSATKFGLRGLAGGMREDLRGRGVGVTVVNPGFVRDAGMFAESGAQLPRYVGTVTPTQVGDAVATAIERDRAEVDVAPLGVRAGTRFAQLAPRLAQGVQRRAGAADIAADIARGQRHKR